MANTNLLQDVINSNALVNGKAARIEVRSYKTVNGLWEELPKDPGVIVLDKYLETDELGVPNGREGKEIISVYLMPERNLLVKFWGERKDNGAWHMRRPLIAEVVYIDRSWSM